MFEISTTKILLYVILLAYYNRPAGSVCDDASHVIRSTVECSNALNDLGFSTKVSYWSGLSTNIPSGCSIRNGGDNVPHMEKSSSGTGNGRKDLIPICKGSDSSGKLLLYRYLILKFYLSAEFLLCLTYKTYF